MAHHREKWVAGAVAALTLAHPGSALAQALADRPVGELRGEVQTRYDAALAMTAATRKEYCSCVTRPWESP